MQIILGGLILVIAFSALSAAGSLAGLSAHHQKFDPGPGPALTPGQTVRLELPNGIGTAKVVSVDEAGVATIAPLGVTGPVPPESA